MLRNTAFATLYALVADKANAIKIDQKSLALDESQMLTDLDVEE